MKFLSKLQPSFDGCSIVALLLAGIAFLVWGYQSDTFNAQVLSLLLCLASFGSAVFIRVLVRRVEADAELEATAAAVAHASRFPGMQEGPDDEQPTLSAHPKPSVKTAIHQVFTQLDLFDEGVKPAHR